jgi:hypothetical protein
MWVGDRTIARNRRLFLVRELGLAPSKAYARVRAAMPQVIEEFDLLSLTYEEQTR